MESDNQATTSKKAKSSKPNAVKELPPNMYPVTFDVFQKFSNLEEYVVKEMDLRGPEIRRINYKKRERFYPKVYQIFYESQVMRDKIMRRGFTLKPMPKFLKEKFMRLPVDEAEASTSKKSRNAKPRNVPLPDENANVSAFTSSAEKSSSDKNKKKSDHEEIEKENFLKHKPKPLSKQIKHLTQQVPESDRNKNKPDIEAESTIKEAQTKRQKDAVAEKFKELEKLKSTAIAETHDTKSPEDRSKLESHSTSSNDKNNKSTVNVPNGKENSSKHKPKPLSKKVQNSAQLTPTVDHNKNKLSTADPQKITNFFTSVPLSKKSEPDNDCDIRKRKPKSPEMSPQTKRRKCTRSSHMVTTNRDSSEDCKKKEQRINIAKHLRKFQSDSISYESGVESSVQIMVDLPVPSNTESSKPTNENFKQFNKPITLKKAKPKNQKKERNTKEDKCKCNKNKTTSVESISDDSDIRSSKQPTEQVVDLTNETHSGSIQNGCTENVNSKSAFKSPLPKRNRIENFEKSTQSPPKNKVKRQSLAEQLSQLNDTFTEMALSSLAGKTSRMVLTKTEIHDWLEGERNVWDDDQEDDIRYFNEKYTAVDRLGAFKLYKEELIEYTKYQLNLAIQKGIGTNVANVNPQGSSQSKVVSAFLQMTFDEYKHLVNSNKQLAESKPIDSLTIREYEAFVGRERRWPHGVYIKLSTLIEFLQTKGIQGPIHLIDIPPRLLSMEDVLEHTNLKEYASLIHKKPPPSYRRLLCLCKEIYLKCCREALWLEGIEFTDKHQENEETLESSIALFSESMAMPPLRVQSSDLRSTQLDAKTSGGCLEQDTNKDDGLNEQVEVISDEQIPPSPEMPSEEPKTTDDIDAGMQQIFISPINSPKDVSTKLSETLNASSIMKKTTGSIPLSPNLFPSSGESDRKSSESQQVVVGAPETVYVSCNHSNAFNTEENNLTVLSLDQTNVNEDPFAGACTNQEDTTVHGMDVMSQPTLDPNIVVKQEHNISDNVTCYFEYSESVQILDIPPSEPIVIEDEETTPDLLEMLLSHPPKPIKPTPVAVNLTYLPSTSSLDNFPLAQRFASNFTLTQNQSVLQTLDAEKDRESRGDSHNKSDCIEDEEAGEVINLKHDSQVPKEKPTDVEENESSCKSVDKSQELLTSGSSCLSNSLDRRQSSKLTPAEVSYVYIAPQNIPSEIELTQNCLRKSSSQPMNSKQADGVTSKEIQIANEVTEAQRDINAGADSAETLRGRNLPQETNNDVMVECGTNVSKQAQSSATIPVSEESVFVTPDDVIIENSEICANSPKDFSKEASESVLSLVQAPVTAFTNLDSDFRSDVLTSKADSQDVELLDEFESSADLEDGDASVTTMNVVEDKSEISGLSKNTQGTVEVCGASLNVVQPECCPQNVEQTKGTEDDESSKKMPRMFSVGDVLTNIDGTEQVPASLDNSKSPELIEEKPESISNDNSSINDSGEVILIEEENDLMKITVDPPQNDPHDMGTKIIDDSKAHTNDDSHEVELIEEEEDFESTELLLDKSDPKEFEISSKSKSHDYPLNSPIEVDEDLEFVSLLEEKMDRKEPDGLPLNNEGDLETPYFQDDSHCVERIEKEEDIEPPALVEDKMNPRGLEICSKQNPLNAINKDDRETPKVNNRIDTSEYISINDSSDVELIEIEDDSESITQLSDNEHEKQSNACKTSEVAKSLNASEDNSNDDSDEVELIEDKETLESTELLLDKMDPKGLEIRLKLANDNENDTEDHCDELKEEEDLESQLQLAHKKLENDANPKSPFLLTKVSNEKELETSPNLADTTKNIANHSFHEIRLVVDENDTVHDKVDPKERAKDNSANLHDEKISKTGKISATCITEEDQYTSDSDSIESPKFTSHIPEIAKHKHRNLEAISKAVDMVSKLISKRRTSENTNNSHHSALVQMQIPPQFEDVACTNRDQEMIHTNPPSTSSLQSGATEPLTNSVCNQQTSMVDKEKIWNTPAYFPITPMLIKIIEEQSSTEEGEDVEKLIEVPLLIPQRFIKSLSLNLTPEVRKQIAGESATYLSCDLKLNEQFFYTSLHSAPTNPNAMISPTINRILFDESLIRNCLNDEANVTNPPTMHIEPRNSLKIDTETPVVDVPRSPSKKISTKLSPKRKSKKPAFPKKTSKTQSELNFVPQKTHAFRSLPLGAGKKPASGETNTITTAPLTTVEEIDYLIEDASQLLIASSTASQMLGTDCTYFEGSQLLQNVDECSVPKQVQNSIKEPQISAESKVNTLTHITLSEGLMARRVWQVNLQWKTKAKTYIEVSFSSDRRSLTVCDESAKLLFNFSPTTWCDVLRVLKEIDQFEYRRTPLNNNRAVTPLHKVLRLLFGTASQVADVRLITDSFNPYATCEKISPAYRKPFKCLTNAIPANILHRMKGLKENLRNASE